MKTKKRKTGIEIPKLESFVPMPSIKPAKESVNQPQTIDWSLKCAKCGFEFSIMFDADESEENRRFLRKCPCGEQMEIIKEIKWDQRGKMIVR